MAECKSTDELSVLLLRLMNELMHHKLLLEKTTGEGYMYLAKARILLGKERVSTLQFPIAFSENVPPLYTVHRQPNKEDEFSLIEYNFQSCLKLEEAAKEKNSSSTSEKDMEIVRRKVENKPGNTPGSVEDISRDSCNSVTKYKDPLNWFGVLVPQELKMAQKAFKQAVVHSVDCANIQSKIEIVMKKLEQSKLNCI